MSALSRVLGQARALRLLEPLLSEKRLPPALVFFGPDGVGKATAAVELAKAFQADLQVVNAAYQAGLREEEPEKQRAIRVETIRHAVKDLSLKSLLGNWKAAVVEDAHRMVPEAANALLKALEEPPPRTVWILVTAQRDQLLPTVLSRCHRVPFGSLSQEVVAEILRGTGVPAAEAASLAARAEGSVGRALALRERPLPDPAAWLGDPLAPFRAAESLPRELHLARPAAEDYLRAAAWHLHGLRARRSLDRLNRLREALRSNASPGLIVQLAALEVQRAAGTGRPR